MATLPMCLRPSALKFPHHRAEITAQALPGPDPGTNRINPAREEPDTMKNLLQALLASLTLAFCTQGALAQERGTKEEAKAMAEAAAAHVKSVGAEKAFKDFNTDKAAWTRKDLYVIAFDWAGNCMAHGANEKLVGKNLIEMKDQQGRFFTKALIDVAKLNGSGWTDYEWVHPVTKKLEAKSTYSLKLTGYEGMVGVGIYR
jgi:signal transduction histidine kinase